MEYLELLYRALHSPHGIVVETENFSLTKQNLYQARKGEQNPELDKLTIEVSPENPRHLWIRKCHELPKT